MNKDFLNKMKKSLTDIIKTCTLASFIVISTVILSIAGLLHSVVKHEKIRFDMERPMFASVFVSDPFLGFMDEDDAVDEDELSEQELEEVQTDSEGNIVVATDENVNQEETTQAVNTPFQFRHVEEDYFDDALFIGDSRVEGLKLYSGLDNAKFYSKEGISLNKILTEKFVKIKIDGVKKEVSIKRALKEKKFAKIYIMIGINEISYRSKSDFKQKYKEVIGEIQKLQPNAKVIILGIMKVTNEYEKKNKGFSNKTIDKFNSEISKLADNQTVFYIDMNENITDSTGAIKKKYTWDGVHLKAEYYSIWLDTLKNHGV